MRYRVDLRYLGTHYHGWQRQPESITVQQCLEEVLSRVLQEKVETTGAGRTDAGVHARHFVAHFDTVAPIANLSRVLLSCNQLLPPDIALHALYPVHAHFHARFDAIGRHYCYRIVRRFDPFLHDRALLYRGTLQLEAMQHAANYILGEGNFASFCLKGGNQRTTLCTVQESYWVEREWVWEYHVQANRFLRGMVRSLVGTLLAVGKGQLTYADWLHILAGQDRRLARDTAPAHGLTLEEVLYPLQEDGSLNPF